MKLIEYIMKILIILFLLLINYKSSLFAQSSTITISSGWNSDESDRTTSLAWGDVDNDGDLDLAVSNNVQPIRLYINYEGSLLSKAEWSSFEYDSTMHLAWGDMNSDGYLDLAVANWESSNKVYLNKGGILETIASWNSHDDDNSYCIAWGDVNKDGYLDLAVGNGGFRASETNKIYINYNGKLENEASWISDENDPTTSIAWADIGNDGNLSLAVCR